MKIRLNDLNKINEKIENEIKSNIDKVIFDKSFNSKKFINEFTEKFLKLNKIKYGIPCANETIGLYTAGKILDLGEGDEIICPTYTGISSISPFVLLGVKPIFIDSNQYSFVLDELKIEEALTENTKAILAVHLYGNPCRMEIIKKIADKYNLRVIEDCSHAHFAKYKGKFVGSWGDIGVFSFNFDKNIGAYGNAGMIVTSDEDLYNYIRKFVYLDDISQCENTECGMNFRMDEIQGAVLSAKVDEMVSNFTKRNNISRIYSNHFIRNEGVIQQLPTPGSFHAYHMFSILVKNRNYVKDHMFKNNIEVGDYYSTPLHLRKEFEYLGYKEGDFPISENIAKKILNLPIYANFSLEHLNYVVEKLNEVTL